MEQALAARDEEHQKMLDATMRQQEQHHVERTNLLLQQQLEAGRTRTEEILKVSDASELFVYSVNFVGHCDYTSTFARTKRLVYIKNAFALFDAKYYFYPQLFILSPLPLFEFHTHPTRAHILY